MPVLPPHISKDKQDKPQEITSFRYQGAAVIIRDEKPVRENLYLSCLSASMLILNGESGGHSVLEDTVAHRKSGIGVVEKAAHLATSRRLLWADLRPAFKASYTQQADLSLHYHFIQMYKGR